jgi:hypothetical protein
MRVVRGCFYLSNTGAMPEKSRGLGQSPSTSFHSAIPFSSNPVSGQLSAIRCALPHRKRHRWRPFIMRITGKPDKWQRIQREPTQLRSTSPISRLLVQVNWVCKHCGITQDRFSRRRGRLPLQRSCPTSYLLPSIEALDLKVIDIHRTTMYKTSTYGYE